MTEHTREYFTRGTTLLVRYPAEHGDTAFYVGDYATPAEAQAEAGESNAYWQRLALNRVSTERLTRFFD